jgi:hypothetical protein
VYQVGSISCGYLKVNKGTAVMNKYQRTRTNCSYTIYFDCGQIGVRIIPVLLAGMHSNKAVDNSTQLIGIFSANNTTLIRK